MRVTLFGGYYHRRVIVVDTDARWLRVPVPYRCGCIGCDIYERSSDVGLFARHELPHQRHPGQVVGEAAAPSEWEPDTDGDGWQG